MKKKEILMTVLLLILDQGSKFGLEYLLKSGSITLIPSFFSLDYVKNTGAAWSIFPNQVLLLIIVSIICLFALSFMKPTVKDSNLKSVSFSFLYAGIMGNLLDRVVFGFVKDFFSFNIFGYHFPVFNVADMLIVVGAILLFIVIWKGDKNEQNNRGNRRKRKAR